MSMQDLPIGRRRDDHTEVVQPFGVSTAPSWDTVLDRLAKLERSHADLARFVASIHEALPAEIAAATGRTLALGSPIDAVMPPPYAAVAPPILGTPPPPLPQRVDPPGVAAGIDPFTQHYEAPDPWAAPATAGDFFQPLAASAVLPAPERPKRRFRGRRAAREAQARIAAEFASAPPPPPGWGAHDAGIAVAPPAPPGFGTEVPTPDFGLPPGWGMPDRSLAAPLASPQPAAPPPPPGFASGIPAESFAPPPGWFGSAAEQVAAPAPPMGFAFDMAEPGAAEIAGSNDAGPTSWATADLSSPADFDFDVPAQMTGPGGEPHADLAPVSPPPPPAGFGPEGYQGLSAVPPPPPGFGEHADAPPPPNPIGFGSPDLVSADGPSPPPPGFGPEAHHGLSAMPPPPIGFASPDLASADRASPTATWVRRRAPPPPGFEPGNPAGVVPPPPGFGPATQAHSNEVFGDLQEMASLVTPEQVTPEPEEEARFLAGTGTDRTNYSAVPPITPDFFARSTGKGRK